MKSEVFHFNLQLMAFRMDGWYCRRGFFGWFLGIFFGIGWAQGRAGQRLGGMRFFGLLGREIGLLSGGCHPATRVRGRSSRRRCAAHTCATISRARNAVARFSTFLVLGWDVGGGCGRLCFGRAGYWLVVGCIFGMSWARGRAGQRLGGMRFFG